MPGCGLEYVVTASIGAVPRCRTGVRASGCASILLRCGATGAELPTTSHPRGPVGHRVRSRRPPRWPGGWRASRRARPRRRHRRRRAPSRRAPRSSSTEGPHRLLAGAQHDGVDGEVRALGGRVVTDRDGDVQAVVVDAVVADTTPVTCSTPLAFSAARCTQPGGLAEPLADRACALRCSRYTCARARLGLRGDEPATGRRPGRRRPTPPSTPRGPGRRSARWSGTR